MTQTAIIRAGAVYARSPEHDALVACTRVSVSEAELRVALGAVIDWQRLRSLALHHAMLPLLYDAILRAGPELVPPLVLKELKLLNRANAERCMRLTAQLLTILSSFEAHDIPVAAFKGPLLSQYAYGDVTMRTFQDLDVFVAKSNLVPARRLLEAYGLRHRLAPGRPARADEFHDVMRGSGVTVELHWRTGPAYVPLLQAEGVLARCRSTTLLGREVPALDPGDLLLVLCAHGHAHQWAHLELIAASARVLEKGDFGDPGLFLQRAESLGCLRRCLIAAQLAREVAGVELPSQFDAALTADRLGRYLSSQVKAVSDRRRSVVAFRSGAALWRSLALDRPKDGVRLATLQVFAPRAEDVSDAASSRSILRSARVQRVRRLVNSMGARRPFLGREA